MTTTTMFDAKQTDEGRNLLFHLFDILRTEGIHAFDYDVVLYLAYLFKEGIDITTIENIKTAKRVEEKQVDENSQSLGISLYDDFAPILSQMNGRVLSKINSVLEKLGRKYLQENFTFIFDSLLYHRNNTLGKFGGGGLLPQEVARFICGLVSIKKNAKVYNPFAGIASFGVFWNSKISYFGQEYNSRTWALGYLRLLAYGRTDSSQWVLDNSITHWNPTPNERFDLVVASPPFGLRLSKNDRDLFGAIDTCEHFLIEKGINDLKEDGKLIALIPNGPLVRNGSEYRLRKYLVDNNLLEMVVALPSNLLTETSIPTNVLVINKDKKNDQVMLVDAKSFVGNQRKGNPILKDEELLAIIHSRAETDFIRFVSGDAIQANDYNLSVGRYFLPLIQNNEGGIVVKLRELVQPIMGRRIQLPNRGKLVRIKNLKEDVIDNELNLIELEDEEISRSVQQISESCLLLSTRLKNLKPTVFNYTGEAINIYPDILAVKVDSAKVNVAFLVNELSADYVIEQVDLLRSGSLMLNITRDDLLSVVVRLPKTLQDQKDSIGKTIMNLVDKMTRDFNVKIRGLESEIVEQNTHLRHTLAGPSSNLKDGISNIKKIMLDKIVPLFPEVLSLKVAENYQLSLGEYLDIIERDATKITNAVRRQLKVEIDIESKHLVPIEIVSFIDEFVRELTDKRGLNFAIDFSYDKETFLDVDGSLIKTYISANPELLSNLFSNLVDNAVKHAFPGNTENRIEIYLMADDTSPEQITILFSNTGKAFPTNFTLQDFIRKGLSIGPNAGDGFGGWYIYKVIERFNGYFDIIDETGPEGLLETDLATSFEINFPIIEQDEKQ